jgi:hypothetical protein
MRYRKREGTNVLSDEQIAEKVARGRDDAGHIRPDVVFELRGAKVAVPRIAKEFGVSRNAIYKILRSRPDLLEYKYRNDQVRLSPWKDVDVETHGKSVQRQYVAHHIEYMLSKGVGMDDYKLRKLRYFWKELGDPQDLVLTYNPYEKPNQWSSTGGWRYEPKQDSDGDLIIRTEDPLTEEQKKIFVRPTEWRDV